MWTKIGHSLLHYLYTGTYQTLKPREVSVITSDKTTGHKGNNKACDTERLLEYKRGVRLYCVAKTYDLCQLEMLSIDQIESFDDVISIWDTLDIAEEAYRKLPDHDWWFTMYLQQKMQAAISKDHHFLTRNKLQGRIGRVARFDKALMMIIAEIYTERNGPVEVPEDDVDIDEA